MSLTDSYNFIIEAALDAISENFRTDCSWIQLANPVDGALSLASFRNFSHEVKNEMHQMDMNHYFAREIVGLGNRIIIPNLSSDGIYGISVFEKAGFSSLIAVPIMTYKVLGIIGIAYRKRKKFSGDFSRLFSVIANLVGMALKKDTMVECLLPPEAKQPGDEQISIQNSAEPAGEVSFAVNIEKEENPSVHQTERKHEAFRNHARKMESFRKLHN